LKQTAGGTKQELKPPFKGSWSTCNHEIYARTTTNTGSSTNPANNATLLR